MHRPLRSTRVTIVANPTAGRGRSRSAGALAACRERGIDAHRVATRAPGDATLLARNAAAAGSDLVVAEGGDGTVNEVAAGLLGSPVPMAVAPAGTMNLLARVLGLPLDPAAAIGWILESGRVREVRPGIAGSRPFLLMAGVGFDAWVLREIRRGRRGRIGFVSYVVGAARGLVSYPYPGVRFRVPGSAPLRGHTAIIGRSPLYGGFLRPTPGAALSDDALELCVFSGGPGAFLRCLPLLWSAAHVGRPGIVMARASSLAVDSEAGDVPYQVDGESAGVLPESFGLASETLRVLAPARVDTHRDGR